MKRLSKKKRLIILLAPVGLWILTLGIHIEMSVESECQQPSGYTFDDFNNGTASMCISGYLARNSRVLHGIKYLFTISTDELPSGLHILIRSAKADKGDIVSITDLRITHSPEESYILVHPERPTEASCVVYSDSGTKYGHPPHYQIMIDFPKAVKHRSSFEVYIKGSIHHKEGSEHFEQKLKTKYIRERTILPGWYVLALRYAFGPVDTTWP